MQLLVLERLEKFNIAELAFDGMLQFLIVRCSLN
jgi:hypothetical protein